MENLLASVNHQATEHKTDAVRVSPERAAWRAGRWSFWRLSIPVGAAVLALLVGASMVLSPLLAFAGVIFLGALLVVIMFPVFLVPKLWRLGSASSYREIRWAYRLHAVRGVVIAASGLAFLLLPFEFASEHLLRFLVVGVPLLFFGIPAAGAGVSFLLKHQPDAGLFRQNKLVKRSRLLAEVTWVASGVLVAAVIWVFSLWPISLREGPNTPQAQRGFEQTFGFPPPSAVKNVYYRQFLFWQTNDVYVKFHYQDREVVERILAELDLEPSDYPQTFQVIKDLFPSRWLTEGREASEPVSEFHTGRGNWAGRRSVWIDRDRQILYYMAFY
jgi:hypothetical protein